MGQGPDSRRALRRQHRRRRPAARPRRKGGNGRQSSPDIEDILDEESLAGWELPLLRRHNLRYVVGDRRAGRADSLRGYYFVA